MHCSLVLLFKGWKVSGIFGNVFALAALDFRGKRHLWAVIAADSAYTEPHNHLGVLLQDVGLVREVCTP
jgi:hypothetical protein